MQFFEWFSEWGSDLWALVRLGHASEEGLKDEFLAVLQYTHRKLKSYRREPGAEERTQIFLHEWRRRQKQKRFQGKVSPNQSEAKLFDLKWEDRMILVGLFRLEWRLAEMSRVAGLSPSTLRFRAFHALKMFSGVPDTDYIDAECPRYDLHLIDALLDSDWKDPLGLYGKKQFMAHQKSCPRCGALHVTFSQGLAQIRSTELPALPENLSFLAESDLESSMRYFAPAWLATWPWYMRIPIQLSFLSLVIYFVLVIPYVGDLFPTFKSDLKQQVKALPRLPSLPSLPHLPSLSQWIVQKDATPSAAPKASEVGVPAPAFLGRVRDALQASAPPVVVPPKAKAVPELPPTVPVKVKAASELPPAAPVKATVPSPVPTLTSKNLPKAPSVAAVVAETTNSAPEPETTENTDTKNTKKAERVFFRWLAYSAASDESVKQLLEVMKRFNVQQAGELGLGADYRGGRYFHFTVPNGQYEPLLKAIEKLNLLRFSQVRVPSDRDVPAGQRRVVFWLGSEEP